ncbi:hypothetical protein AMTR_s00023p00229170 [Amborella trichopoda]|uniref:Uncharacterized protein n=1 Tax=Amborella trichopoda TaxID=13333 RepID=W1NJN6_AMBTC|nr:hypothetical protein AMTR_s00023p00229170 [Amborella trichopoda]
MGGKRSHCLHNENFLQLPQVLDLLESFHDRIQNLHEVGKLVIKVITSLVDHHNIRMFHAYEFIRSVRTRAHFVTTLFVIR